MDHLAHAWQLYEVERYQDAMLEAKAALRDEPEDVEALSLLAVCEVYCLHRAKATKTALQAVRLGPEEPIAWWVLGTVHHENGEIKAARASAYKWLETEPNSVNARIMLVKGYLAESDYERCIERLDQVLAIDPEHETAKALKTTVLTYMGRSSDAMKMAYEGLSDAPDSPDAHATQAWVHLEAGRVREAVLMYREALRIDPQNRYAEDGLKEALRRHIPPYRWMMKAVMLMARVPQRHSWVFGAAILVAVGVFRSFNDHLSVYVGVWSIMLMLASLYFLAPLCVNIYLLTHPLGRIALTVAERAEAVSLATVFVLTGAGIYLMNSLGLSGWMLLPPVLAAALLVVSPHISYSTQGRKTIAWIAPSACLAGLLFILLTGSRMGV